MATEFIEISEDEYQGGASDFIEITEEEFNTPQEPVGTSIGQEISQLPAALKQSFGQPLEAIGETAQVAGFPAVGAALKGAIEEPEGYVSAGQRFMEPQEGEFQVAGFAPQYAPRAIVEQTGQLIGSIGSRIAGAVTLGGLGALISPATGVAGVAAGQFAGPALFEAAQIVGPVALERAKNNGYTEPTDEDMAYAITTAAGSGLLNAFGAKYLPGGEKAVGSFSKRLAASFIGEGIPEGLQSLVQQVGETVETKKGIQVSPKQAVGEALIGGGAGAAATVIAAPFTPEQIEEQKITESANKEAENLVIGNDNPQGKAVLANKQKLEQEIADAKQVLSVIESTDPIAQKLKLELKEKEAILAAAQGQVDSIIESADPVTEAEKQQIELAKAITAPVAPAEAAPEVAAPAAPKPLPTDVLPTETPSATYGREEQVYDVFGGITRKPVSIPKPAELPAAPTIEEQTAEKTYGGETGVFDVFAGARRKPVVTEEPSVSMVGKQVIPGVTPVPVVSAQPKATKEAIASATNAANQIEEENRVLEKLTKFNPPSAPTLQDARSLPDAVAKKGRTLSISGGKQEKNILDPKESKKRFDDIGYERQALELPEDMNDRVSGRYGSAIANIKSLYSLQWLGAHFHGGVAVNPEVKGTQRGRIVAHELGHASHSLLGDQINKDQNVLNELQAIEELLYPGLRAKVSASSNPDAGFFNYLLSPNELIAEFNVERISNPERAAQVAPALSALLESAEKMKGLVADRKTFPTFIGVIIESKERLKVKDLESRKIKEASEDELTSKYKQWSEKSKWILKWGKEGKLKNLKAAKTALWNLRNIYKAPKSFAKRTAELTGNQELIDYVEELYPAPTEPTVKESLPVAPEAPAITPAPVAETPAVTEAPAAEVTPATQVEQEIEVGDEASVNLAGRNETVTIVRIEDINGVPTAYFDYFGYKSRPLSEMQLAKKSDRNIAKAKRKAEETSKVEEEIKELPAKNFSPSPKTSTAIESQETTNLRNKIKEAKGNDRKIVVMQAMSEGVFFPSAIEAAEFGKPFPSIDKALSSNLPDELKGRIDTSKIKLPVIKLKSPEEAASKLISNDDTRPTLGGVYFDAKNNVVVATDGKALVAIPKKITGGDKIVAARNIKKTTYQAEIKKGQLIDANYPNWKQVIPTGENEKVDIDIDDTLKAATILDSLNNTLNNKDEKSLIYFKDARFDPSYILSSVTALVESGAKSITAQIGSKEDPLLLTGNNGSIAVVMPIKSNIAILHPIKARQSKPKLGEKGGVLIPSREDFIQAGQNIYEAGMEFGAWAKQMIQQFGDVVREFLGDVWQAVSGAPAKLNELMGYLPKKGEGGELSFGKTGKLKRYTDKGTIVKLAIKQEKDTPKGILSETIKIIKQRVFDGDSTPSESATKKAWGLIERLVVTNPDSTSTAEAINQLTRETMQEVSVAEGATEGERQAFEAIKQTVGATKLNNELFKYAIKLAGQGDNSMLNYLLNNELNVVGTSVKSRGDVGRTLRALEGLKSYIVQANEAEQAGFIQLAAQRFFNTTTPTEDQIAQIKRILTAVNETKVNEEEAILDELTQVGEKIGTELVENINTQIDKASKPEVKDPMVAAITAMLKLGGTFVYKKTKNKIKAAVEKTIKGGITNYRDKLVEGAANGLETGFWKTLSSQENKPGPLGELDSAQNRELGNIVKSTLVSMKLQGKPPNTKMDIYEQVASILGEKPLSQDKIKLADEKIRGEINSKRQNELEQTEDQDVKDAINLKYDQIEKAWDMAMSQQLDMPVSDAMLRRLIFNELKEGKTSVAKLATLMNEEPTIGASRQDRIVSSIINKIAGVTFEGQNPADYTALKEYLSNELESLIREKQTENKVVKTKEKIKANQAQTELDKLARIQSDTPNFPTSEKVANPVRDAVRNALKLVLNPMFNPKASADIMRNWKKSFAAELQQLGVDETTALTLTDVVGRQIELDSVSKNLDAIDNAINKGALSGVINAIKNTPLADQQKPDWRYEVMRDYLRSAGLPMAQAEKIAKLMDISLQKRFAKAQEEAAASIAKTILGGIKPESNRGFTALIQAIRAQVLNPGSNVAKEFGRAMGWKGFTAEQLKALNEFDSKINDETITEAERAVALEGIKKIIDKVALPTRVRDSLSAFYIGQALGRLPVATVQVVDPAIFSGWDAAVAGLKNITSPELAMQIWGNYISSLINAGREFAFSFKNDVTRSGRLVDYLETQDRKLKRLRNDADNLWKNGQYKQAIKKYLFSYPEITSRILKALDDASFSLLQQNALNQYMISAMNMAKIPKKDQLGALRMIAQARQMDIANMMADGISKNDAIIYANERMKAEISRVMSGLNLNSSEIIDAAINDSLARIGKNRFKEQFNGETEIKDEGTLSYPFLKMYEGTSRLVADVKGVRGEVMRIFQRMLFGFPLIVAKVGNVAYGYVPLTIYRHIFKGNYPLTYGTAIQQRKRLAEQLTGFAVLTSLLFLRSMSFDDDDDKKPISIVFTGFGPVRSKDPEAYNQWHKKHNPGSLEIFIGGKRYALDSKSSGPLKPMIEILGAIDDWQIRKFQDGAKMTKEEMKKAQENAGLLGTLGEIAGSLFLTAARRGPATGLMQGLIDFRRYPDDPIAAIAQEASFSFTPLIPVVGFGATKNVSDFLSEPIDTRTKEGAILNNLPIIGPMFGKPAINAFGQPIGDVEISEKIKKSIGIPITLVPVSSGDDAKLAKITLKNANGPEPLQRNWFDSKFETPLSDQEWRTVNEDYARSNRKTVLENYEELNGFDPEIYKTAISNVGTASKYLALDNLYKARKKP